MDSLNIGMIGEYICTTEMLPNVYYLLNQEIKGVLEIALNNSLNPVDTDFEGFYNLLFFLHFFFINGFS